MAIYEVIESMSEKHIWIILAEFGGAKDANCMIWWTHGPEVGNVVRAPSVVLPRRKRDVASQYQVKNTRQWMVLAATVLEYCFAKDSIY
jgi:hypothetical protein